VLIQKRTRRHRKINICASVIVVANTDGLRYHPQHRYSTLGFAFFPVYFGFLLKAERPCWRNTARAILKKKGRPNETNHSLSLLGNREPDERRTYDCGFTT
jgi:hypothetical protein